MVIMRTTNTLVDGTKRRIAYYACGNWKNKCTAVCTSNTIRVEKANDYVFGKISELLTNDRMARAIVNNVNTDRVCRVSPAKKDLHRIEIELEHIEKKKNKLFEAFEDDILTTEEFKDRKNSLNEKARNLLEQKQPLLSILTDDASEEIPYKYIKSILDNFSKVLSESTSREQQKKLLHMIISEITISETREIDSIKLKFNDALVDYLNKEEGVSVTGTPSSFSLKKAGLSTINIDIAI
jgi:site-specific DNA recombinase